MKRAAKVQCRATNQVWWLTEDGDLVRWSVENSRRNGREATFIEVSVASLKQHREQT